MKKKTKSSYQNKYAFIFWLLLAVCIYLLILHLNLFSKTYNSQLRKINQEPVAFISWKENTVQRKFAERAAWDRLSPESKLYEGDTIYTLNNSCAVVSFIDGTILSLDENTMARISGNSDKNCGAELITGTLLAETSEITGSFTLKSGNKEILLKENSSYLAELPENPDAEGKKEKASVLSMLKEKTAGENNPLRNTSIAEIIASGIKGFNDEDNKSEAKEKTVKKSAAKTDKSTKPAAKKSTAASKPEQKKYETEIDAALEGVIKSLSFAEDLNALNRTAGNKRIIKLTWRGVNDATAYNVKVYNSKGKLLYHEVVPYSDRLFHEASCTLDAEDEKLFPEGEYEWSVTAFRCRETNGKVIYEAASMASVSSFIIKK